MFESEAVSIVAFGDSITAAVEQPCEGRWPEIVRRGLCERFPEADVRMVNAGVGGNTSREGLARIEEDVLRHRPEFVTVEFGNDATPDPERHVSLDEFSANLDAIRRKVVEGCSAEMILLTFPPIIDEWHSQYGHEFYREYGGQDAYHEPYRDCTREFAAASDCPLVDIDRALREQIATRGPEPFILPDGVHLTAQGNEVAADAVLGCLSRRVVRD